MPVTSAYGNNFALNAALNGDAAPTGEPGVAGVAPVGSDAGFPALPQDPVPEPPSAQNSFTPPPSRGGPIKTLLTRLSYGAGQAMLHQAGLPTDFDIQRQQFNQQLQASQQDLERQRFEYQKQYQNQLVTLPNGIQVPRAVAEKAYPAALSAQGKVESAQIAKRFIPVPGVGLFDSQNHQIVPGTSQGITITPEIAQDFNLPQEYVGKPLPLSQFNSLQRNQISQLPTYSTTTDSLGLTSNTVRRKGGVPQFVTPAPRGGAVSAPSAGGGSATGAIPSMAQQLVEGTADPSQIPKRGNAYMATLAAANAYSQQKYGKPFDLAQASTDYKFANEASTQNTLKYLNSLTGADNKGGNLQKLVDLSNKLPRTEFPPINDAQAYARLKSGSGPQAAYAATITEVADQVAKILQGGSTGNGTSDAKLKQANELFQKGFTSDQIKDVATSLRDLLANRKGELIGDNRYLKKQFGSGAVQQVVAPSGADNEVYVKGKLVGHTVGGKYVPLGAQ